MKNEFDDKYIANEVKKYIDNIQVPEELGGMIIKITIKHITTFFITLPPFSFCKKIFIMNSL